jgi:hypothetical protein
VKTGDMSKPAETRIGHVAFEEVEWEGGNDCVGHIAKHLTSCECNLLEQLWIQRFCPSEEADKDWFPSPAETFTDKNSVTFWSTPEV